MKKLILFIFLFKIFLSGNTLPKEWVPIYIDTNSTIYLNEAKIIGYGNDISVWSIEEFREIQKLENGTEFIKKKSHYLFNKMRRKYASVGDIYYNQKGKIVNRSSSAGFQNSSPAFMASIKSNPKVETIYKEAISFLITGNLTPINNEPGKSVKENESLKIPDNEIAIEATKVVDSHNLIDEKKFTEENSREESNKLLAINKPNIKSVVSLRELDKKKLNEPINILPPKPVEYNLKNEKALKDAIFTDGNLFCIQVSSWKTKAYADRELDKLLKKGFKAFIVSVKPKNKRSIWHRVRVGYFDNLNEAKMVQREIKRIK